MILRICRGHAKYVLTVIRSTNILVEYIVIIVLSCVALLISAWLSVSVQRKVAYSIILLLTLFSALRGYVGTDTYSYHQIFWDATDQTRGDLYSRIEPLFGVLIDLFSSLGFGSSIFIAAISVLQGALLLFVVRLLPNPAMFLASYVAILFINLHFNIIRSGVSILFVLIALGLMQQGSRCLLGWAISGLSVAAHYSAFVFVGPLLIFFNRGRYKIFLVSVLSLFFLGGLYYIGVNDDLLGKMSIYSEVLSEPRRQTGGGTLFVALILYSVLFYSVQGLMRAELRYIVWASFAVWFVLRVVTHFYEIVGRLEIIAATLFIYSVFSVNLSGRSRQLRRLTTVLLVLAYVGIGLYGLSQEKQTLLDSFGNSVENKSPFVPYRFTWEQD